MRGEALRSDAAPLVALDANALDRPDATQDRLLTDVRALVNEGRVRLFLPSGVVAELRHPNAPAAIRAAAADAASPPVVLPLSARQHIDRIRVRAILRGDGRPGKHDADAAHLSEAAEAGCDWFVTQDGKILRRRDVLRAALPDRFRIASPAEFLAAVDQDRDATGGPG